jgi:hypothetical protein
MISECVTSSLVQRDQSRILISFRHGLIVVSGRDQSSDFELLDDALALQRPWKRCGAAFSAIDVLGVDWRSSVD